jgi:predicted RNA binding protein YcfA (HicA-like mRNA interferase family)
MKARRLLAVLEREPLGYREVRRRGSHRILAAPGRPGLLFAFHDGTTLPGGVVRAILVDRVGLDETTARGLL